MPERVDATGERFADHLGTAGMLLSLATVCYADGDTENALEQIAAARRRLDAAERMLKEGV